MPNRILREGIVTSERVASLDWAAEVFYRRLHSVVDDFGRYYAKPELLRAACYPLQLDRVGNPDVAKWLSATRKAALVRTYAIEGKEYLEVLDFRQQVRTKKSKYPDPPSECDADAAQMHSKRLASAHLGGDVIESEGGGASESPGTVSAGATRRDHVSTLLRAAGVQVTSQNPMLVAWVDELHATDAQLTEALERARLRKPTPAKIPAAYLDPIVREVCEPKNAKRVNGYHTGGAWWTSEAATKAKGREVGIEPRPGESADDFKGRINLAIEQRKSAHP